MLMNGLNSTLLNLKSQLKLLQKLKLGKLMNKNSMKNKPQKGIRFIFILIEPDNKKLLIDSKSTSARNQQELPNMLQEDDILK